MVVVILRSRSNRRRRSSCQVQLRYRNEYTKGLGEWQRDGGDDDETRMNDGVMTERDDDQSEGEA